MTRLAQETKDAAKETQPAEATPQPARKPYDEQWPGYNPGTYIDYNPGYAHQPVTFTGIETGTFIALAFIVGFMTCHYLNAYINAAHQRNRNETT